MASVKMTVIGNLPWSVEAFALDESDVAQLILLWLLDPFKNAMLESSTPDMPLI